MSIPSPFYRFNIHRGQARGLSGGTGLFSFASTNTKVDESGQTSNEHEVGYFKGLISLHNTQTRDAQNAETKELQDELIHNVKELHKKELGKDLDIKIEYLTQPEKKAEIKKALRKLGIDHLDIIKSLALMNEAETIKKQLLVPKACTVRLYLIDGFGMPWRDNDSNSDPYAYITCNGVTYNERDHYQLDTSDPKFYKHYDFKCSFPGTGPLNIAVWDYDGLFGDDLIGVTSIDLEDRYFSVEWQSLNNKPIEQRSLYCESSSAPQGTIQCWVEIIPDTIDLRRVKLWDIAPKPPAKMEVRLCVLNCEGVSKAGDNWDLMDPYVRCFFDSAEDAQETDTHYRCQNDKPDYQYRLIYNTTYPRPKNDYSISLVIQDRDFFSANDVLGQANIDVKQIMEDASKTKKLMTMSKKYCSECCATSEQIKNLEFSDDDSNTFWLPFIQRHDGQNKQNGKVRVRIDVLVEEEAVKNKVGLAREEPNHSPHLPQPEGRFEFSLNPFKMLNQLISPEIKAMVLKYLLIAACIALCIAILPNVVGGLITSSITGIFK